MATKKTKTSATTKKRRKMPKTISEYEDLLIEMIEKRTKQEFNIFLTPQVTSCAQCWKMMNKVYDDLIKEKSLTSFKEGSQGQQKEEVNPLLPYYIKLQAEFRNQLQSLGLNMNTTASKFNANPGAKTKGSSGDDDALIGFYSAAAGINNDD